jgi:predicted Mrr-cat superfamily restriction endonuclease
VTNNLILHLGLEVEPQRSYLCIGNAMREEYNGEAIWRFVTEISRTDRVILYIELHLETARVSEGLPQELVL